VANRPALTPVGPFLAQTGDPLMISSRSPGRRIALVGAFVGLFASAYLLVDYVFGSGICLTGSGCDVVRSSAFAYPLGIPMPLLGLGFYLAAVVLLLLNPTRTVARVRAGTAALGWSLIGLGVMAILTTIELAVIGALCSWCLMSAIGSLLLAAGTIAALRHSDAPPEVAAGSSRARRRSSTEAERSRHDLNRFALSTGGVTGVALVALLALPALTSGTPVDQADVGGAARPRLGDGPVEVVVFSDFQCPACAVAAPVLTQLADEGSISLVYRYFPLTSIHPNATPAAQAAEAAARQGSFWPFHDALFASQASWADLPTADAALAYEVIAEDLGLDLARWRADAASSGVADVVGADRREAEQLSLPGTPTIFIDGARYNGQLTHADLLRAVEVAAGG
jgi:protein-disulfide isomerase